MGRGVVVVVDVVVVVRLVVVTGASSSEHGGAVGQPGGMFWITLSAVSSEPQSKASVMSYIVRIPL